MDSTLLNLSLDRPDIEKLLAEKLLQLASEDMEAFFQLLYSIDVDEVKLSALIQKGGDIYPELALLLLHRLKKKKEGRERFTYPEREGEEGRW